jgi:hypothetical protein
MKYSEILKKSWVLLEKHPIFLLPHALGVLFSALWFIIIIMLTSFIDRAVIVKGYADALTLLIGGLYLLVQIMIWFYFTGISYSVYQQVTFKHKKKLKQILRFSHDQFYHIIGVSIFLFVTVMLPLVAIFIIMLSSWFDSISVYIRAFYIAVLVVWLFLISWRLIFIFPIMAVGKPKHHVIHASFHFAKTHMRHTLISWLIAFEILLVMNLSGRVITVATGFDIWLLAIGSMLAIVVEIVLSAWEHLVLYELYIETKHVTVKKK